MSRILVIGAAKSGIAVSKLLANKGYDVILTDAKNINEKAELEKLNIQVYDNGHPEFLKDLKYEFIAKNPGIPYHIPFVKHFNDLNVPIYNEIEIASRFVNYRYGAITGTNGKTTTTTLLAAFLKTLNSDNKACGNIGLPLSEIVLEKGEKELSLAVEIAAFQLLGIKYFHPEVSVCLNLTPDHIDYFKDLNKYYNAKMLVYKNQSAEDWFLLNLDDEEIVKRAIDVPCKIVSYSMEKPADLCLKGQDVYLFDNYLFSASDLKLVGRHNLQNAMVASAMAYKMGVNVATIKEVIKNFKGVEHRIEYVREHNGVTYYNDSKGTNAESTVVALKAFEKPVILLAGGYDKKTGFDAVIPYLNKVKKLYCFGATKDQIKALYKDAVVCEDLKEALSLASKEAIEGDVVLLSPMCASWDQFPNFEVRGAYFKELVNAL